MVKTLRALAALSATTLLLVSSLGAGCSSSSTSTETEVVDSGLDATRPRPVAPVEDAGPQLCPTVDPIASTDLAYKEPTAVRQDCSVDDYNALLDYLNKNDNATVSQVKTFLKGRGGKCYDCVVTDASAATWGPLPTQAGQLVTINVGSCFTLVSGNPALGKDIQNLFDCESLACKDCTDQAEYSACKKKADQGACKAILAQAQKDFANVDEALFDRCGSFTDAVREQCVGVVTDGGDGGGGDADSGDAGDDAADADLDAADADQ